MTSKERLRNFIQKNLNGGCKMLSLGDDCVCPLCDFDRLVEEIDRLTAEGEKAKEVIDEINKLGVIATLGNPRKYAKRVDEVIKYYRNGKA